MIDILCCNEGLDVWIEPNSQDTSASIVPQVGIITKPITDLPVSPKDKNFKKGIFKNCFIFSLAFAINYKL